MIYAPAVDVVSSSAALLSIHSRAQLLFVQAVSVTHLLTHPSSEPLRIDVIHMYLKLL